MSIQNFYQTAAIKDFARVFQFRVNFFGDEFDMPDEYTIYVETAALPGRAITNVPVPYMGLSFNVPGTVTYPGSDAYNVTFRCDQNYDIRSLLEAKTYRIFDESTSTGGYFLSESSNILSLTLLNKERQPVREYALIGAYVKSINEAAYDIKDTGTVQTVQATIAYQFWRPGNNTVKLQGPTSPVPNGDNVATLDNWPVLNQP